MGRRRLLLTVFLACGAVVGALLEFSREDWMTVLCAEDGPVEYLTALSYLVASCLFLRAGMSSSTRSVWYWAYALLFFAVAGEEISWGQRLFDVATPEALVQVNVQGELNLHNVDGVHQNVRAAACGLLLGICYVLPLLDGFGPRRFSVWLQSRRMPVFPLWASGIVTVGLLLMVTPRLFGQMYFDLDELGELYLSIAFLAFGAHVSSFNPRRAEPALAFARVYRG